MPEVNRWARFLAITALALAACGRPSREPIGRDEGAGAALSVGDSAGIAAADSGFRAAVNAGNAAAVAAVYAVDASLLPPNLPVQRGRTAIRTFWAGLFETYTVTFEMSPDLVEGRGDLAYEMGHYRFTAVPKAKTAPGIADEGKFVDILKRQPDGSWKYVVDIYNSNLAPQH